jgi:hypothetical protein
MKNKFSLTTNLNRNILGNKINYLNRFQNKKKEKEEERFLNIKQKYIIVQLINDDIFCCC